MGRAWKQGAGAGELKQSGMDKHLLEHAFVYVCAHVCVPGWIVFVPFCPQKHVCISLVNVDIL